MLDLSQAIKVIFKSLNLDFVKVYKQWRGSKNWRQGVFFFFLMNTKIKLIKY
jgi:hypothetical protein